MTTVMTLTRSPVRRHALVALTLLCGLSALTPSAHAEGSSAAVARLESRNLSNPVPEFDLTQMRARSVTERQLRQPVVRWETLSGSFAACDKASGALDLNLPQQGCAVVDTAQNSCTIYTSSRTTHSIMGHLVRHCFEGRL